MASSSPLVVILPIELVMIIYTHKYAMTIQRNLCKYMARPPQRKCCFEGDGTSINDYILISRKNDTVEYFSNNQSGYAKYRVDYDSIGVKILVLIQDYYGVI